MYLHFYFWSRVSGAITLRWPCGIEYCGCVCVCFMLLLMFAHLLAKYMNTLHTNSNYAWRHHNGQWFRKGCERGTPFTTVDNTGGETAVCLVDHRRQPRRGCRGRIPTNILVGGDINGNVPTNIRGGSVVEYELKTLKTWKNGRYKNVCKCRIKNVRLLCVIRKRACAQQA